MTRTQALIQLRDKVKAGDTPWLYGNIDLVTPALGQGIARPMCHEAYEGSLDAAKALHEAVLPNWYVLLERLPSETWKVLIGTNNDAPRHEWSCAAGACPARAWLLAILQTLTSQEYEE